MKKVGVVLSGCGVYDGSEIHEATLTLYFLDRAGAKIICLAPDINQSHVINHLKTQQVTEVRNVLVESARIARGDIISAKSLKPGDIDALIFPGGLGAAKNLCDYDTMRKGCTVNPEVEKLIKEAHDAGKPLGFICLAPVIAARVLGKFHPFLTIGNDSNAAADIEAMGGKHITCNVDEIAVDNENKIVSTPAYMLGPTIAKVALGIEKLVNEVLQLA